MIFPEPPFSYGEPLKAWFGENRLRNSSACYRTGGTVDPPRKKNAPPLLKATAGFARDDGISVASVLSKMASANDSHPHINATPPNDQLTKNNVFKLNDNSLYCTASVRQQRVSSRRTVCGAHHEQQTREQLYRPHAARKGKHAATGVSI